MARTAKVRQRVFPTIIKSIDYNGGSIAKMSDGTMQASIDGNRSTVANRGEGQAFIDAAKTLAKKHRKPTGPFAGWMKDPPEDCQHIVMDNEKQEWVDVYFCAYKCEKRVTCESAAVLVSGRQERIKALSTGS